jgi:isoleucyl-tRNA synthetase
VANDGKVTVALDVELSDSLREEGIAREIVSKLQNLRKECDFDVMDRIKLVIEPHSYIKNSISNYKTYICTEILATEMELAMPNLAPAEIEVDEHKIKVSITKSN